MPCIVINRHFVSTRENSYKRHSPRCKDVVRCQPLNDIQGTFNLVAAHTCLAKTNLDGQGLAQESSIQNWHGIGQKMNYA